MIHGMIRLEDILIDFSVDFNTTTVMYTIIDVYSGECETLEAPQDKFAKALSIAVHYDGMPEYEKDYPDAESIMGRIRWIP